MTDSTDTDAPAMAWRTVTSLPLRSGYVAIQDATGLDGRRRSRVVASVEVGGSSAAQRLLEAIVGAALGVWTGAPPPR